MLSFFNNQALHCELSIARSINGAIFVLLLGVIAALGQLNCGSTALTQTFVPLTNLQKGDFSGVRGPLQVVVRTQEEWDKLWKRHSSTAKPPSPPRINFATEMVAAVFLGEKNTGGHEVEITRAERKNSTLYIYYLEKRPPSDAIVTQVLTQPYHLVKLPRDDAPVVFLSESK